jgi:hypothetical protein
MPCNASAPKGDIRVGVNSARTGPSRVAFSSDEIGHVEQEFAPWRANPFASIAVSLKIVNAHGIQISFWFVPHAPCVDNAGATRLQQIRQEEFDEHVDGGVVQQTRKWILMLVLAGGKFACRWRRAMSPLKLRADGQHAGEPGL